MDQCRASLLHKQHEQKQEIGALSAFADNVATAASAERVRPPAPTRHGAAGGLVGSAMGRHMLTRRRRLIVAQAGF